MLLPASVQVHTGKPTGYCKSQGRYMNLGEVHIDLMLAITPSYNALVNDWKL